MASQARGALNLTLTHLVAEMACPHLTFTLIGKPALDAARERVSREDWVCQVREVVPTYDGCAAVIDIDTVNDDGSTMSSHTLTEVMLAPTAASASAVPSHRIARLRHWCSGALQQ